MELKDVRALIKDSNNISFLNEMEFELNFPHINESYKILGFYNLYKFIYDQKSGWLLLSLDDYGNSFSDSVNFFTSALTQIELYLNSYALNTGYSDENLRHYFTQTLSRYLIPSNIVLTYNCSSVEFLMNVYKRNVELFAPAFNYITNNGINASNKNNLYGYFLAYEFENKENSFLFNKRESEKRSFNSLRSEFTSFGDNYNNEVSTFIKKVEEDYQENTRLQNKKIAESRSVLAKWLNHNRTNFNGFLETTNTDFSTLFDSTKEEFNNELGQYAKLLELQEPIKYWQIRAKELNKKANELLKWIVGISLVFAGLVYVLLWFTPEGLLESLFSGDKSKAIRWSFVFVIFISIFFVVIRALLKYLFSNFHLARDAEEREKLTYLYISLLSKGDVSEEERKIVFQALFSRSDTGLLKEDSSPTMPGVASYMDRIK